MFRIFSILHYAKMHVCVCIEAKEHKSQFDLSSILSYLLSILVANTYHDFFHGNLLSFTYCWY